MQPVSSEDIVSGYQAALDEAVLQRLNTERLPRAILALAFLSLPLVWLYRKGWRASSWLLAAGLIYAVVFHLRYALLDQRTYSLSSVSSATELILYAGITASLALFVAWLFYAWKRSIFLQEPLTAASSTLDVVLAILFWLSLPLLWSYVVNGALVTWTLPDFASMFLGFLSLLQGLFVAVLGLIITGVSYGVARFRSR